MATVKKYAKECKAFTFVIKGAMSVKGITVEELGKAIGIKSKSTMYKKLADPSKFSVEQSWRMSSLLDLELPVPRAKESLYDSESAKRKRTALR